MLVLFAIMIVFLLRNKSEDNQEIIVEKNKVNLTYCTWDEEEFYMNSLVDKFNQEHPDINVSIEIIPAPTYDSDIVDILQSDAEIDLIGIRGIPQLVNYESRDLLTDITSYIAESDIDVTSYGNMFANVAIDNKYYGMPTRRNCWALVYNKDLFDEMGVPYPGQMTWDEYRNLAKRLTHVNDKGDIVYGGYLLPWDYNILGLQNNSYLYDDDLSKQKAGLEQLNLFYNEDASHMSLKEYEDTNIYYLDFFNSGRAAMMPMGEWIVGMELEFGDQAVNWDLAPMPISEGMNPGTTWGQFQFTGITNTCDYPEEAFEFLKYITSEEGAKIYANHGMLSAYDSENVRNIYRSYVGEKNVDVFFEAYVIQQYPIYLKYPQLNEAFSVEAHDYLVGDISVEDAIGNFMEKRLAIINE